jgi:predicted  nucleic acid-binding Zn-ribbon protein
MPHKCTKCGEVIEDSSDKIMKGCPNCENQKWEMISNTSGDKLTKQNEIDKVKNDLNKQYEGIKIVSDGHYRINIGELYRGNAQIIEIGDDGCYKITSVCSD